MDRARELIEAVVRSRQCFVHSLVLLEGTNGDLGEEEGLMGRVMGLVTNLLGWIGLGSWGILTCPMDLSLMNGPTDDLAGSS